jgi:FlaA1/EpsC-like NDP-sugar epimerase
LEQSELALYKIERELNALKSLVSRAGKKRRGLDIVPCLGSVHDRRLLEILMRKHLVETVYHAAAYKHVPLVEMNPLEGLKNNTFGTWSAACAAKDAGVTHFILVSTDKAVRPTSAMGASKRAAELALQALNTECGRTTFAIVRFGNVLNSSGSVVPLFRQQIRSGGPVTVTDPEVTRYFMTIPEAASLVIQAGSLASGGEVFVLDMGEPVRICDLAKRLINLSGYSIRDETNPSGDIEIKYTGLRRGEKLHEELQYGYMRAQTKHPMIQSVDEDHLPLPEFKELIDRLDMAYQTHSAEKAFEILREYGVIPRAFHGKIL